MAVVSYTNTDIEMSSAQVTFNSVDLGTFVDGVVFTYTVGIEKIYVDQFTMPVRHVITTEDAQAVLTLSEYQLTKIQYALSGGTYVLDSGSVKKKISVGGGTIDESADYLELVITPVVDGSGTIGSDANHKITIYKCVAVSGLETTFQKTGLRGTAVTFEAIRDSSQAAGAQLFLLGDSTAAA